MIAWIKNFYENRKTTVMVNGETSTITSLAQTGLPQGSSLFPILYLFFNSDLVAGIINKNKGSPAFINDFTAWIVSPSIADNFQKIRATVILHLENWAYQSGAVFNSQKTILTHFTQAHCKVNSFEALEKLVLSGATVAPSPQVKILGVVLDQKLNYKAHIAQAFQNGINSALALKKQKNLRPETARRLFQAKVVPVIDYASPIWSPGLSMSLLNKLNVPQKVGGQAVIGAFPIVASIVGESKARLELSTMCHHNEQLSRSRLQL